MLSGREKDTSYRRIMFLIICASLIANCGVLVHSQRSGKYLCQNNIFVQFASDFGTPYAAFSGVYTQTNKLIESRVTYIEKKRMEKSQTVLGASDTA